MVPSTERSPKMFVDLAPLFQNLATSTPDGFCMDNAYVPVPMFPHKIRFVMLKLSPVIAPPEINDPTVYAAAESRES